MSNWSWFTWLSTVPSTIASRWLDVPWNIQRRFIGYAFKRLVLDFIITGVSDEKNLDRQIESGSIFLHSVKLDQQRLNDLLPSLPFSLQGASISKASVQLPSENGRQLTSLLSISHAEFEFRVLARDELSFDMQRNWKELIRTYAASFVNEAISPEKDVSKRPRPLDAEGPLVTIFVALVDRVFHAVNFDASDTKFTLVHPGNFTLIASVASITGRTGSSVEHRRITISGVTIRICDTPEPSTATTSYQRSSRAAESLFSLGKDAVALEIFESLDTTSPNRLRISINAGLIGGAFFSWQLSGLVQLFDDCLAHCSNSSAFKFSQLKIPSSLDLEVALDLRGAVLLILPSGEEDDDTDIHTSIDSFLADLSVPPTLPSGYLRIFLEDIQMHLAAQYTIPHLPRTLSCTTTIGDLSVLGFRSFSEEYDDPTEHTVFPVLISDRALQSHYTPEYIHRRPSSNPEEEFTLPTFHVVDWTDEDAEVLWSEVDLARWRTRTEASSTANVGGGDVTARVPALHLSVNHRFDSSSSTPSWKVLDRVNITTVPLRVFVDLGQVLCPEVLSYLDNVFQTLSYTTSCYHHWDADPREHRQLNLSIHIPVIRFEVRCTLSGLPTRSGALVVDIHEATISIEEHSNTTDGDIVFEIGASHVLVACSPGTGTSVRAPGVFSVGSESSGGTTEQPRLGITRGTPAKLTFMLSIPSNLGRLTGETLDNLQYWIMDAAHLLNSAMDDDWEASKEDEEPEQPTLSRVLAQIGRCFFARGEDEDANEVVVENVVKISAEDTLIRVLVPISNQEGRTIAVRVVDVTATSADALVAYEGDDTLVDLDVKRVTVENRVSSTFSETILSVMPLNSTLPKATIKMRFADPRTRSMDMESGANDIDSPS